MGQETLGTCAVTQIGDTAVKVNRNEYEQASDEAIIVINPPTQVDKVLIGFIVEREVDGGIQDSRIKQGCLCFPVSLLRENRGTYLPGGDWATIPYLRNDDCEITTEANYYSFQVELV